MYLEYNNQTIPVTTTHNKNILKFHFQKLYYAIIIYNCNSYSSIANKQRIDIVMTDNDLNILSIKRNMHENTIYKNENATTTIILPINTFSDLKNNTKLNIIKSKK